MAYQKDLAYWKERARKFGAASIGYGCNERLIRWDNLLRAQAISRLVTIKPGMRVLDVGTGTGYWAIRCARAGAIVTGLDFSEDLLKIADANAREAGVTVSWLHTALEQADLPEEGFDVVLSVTCLQHITERRRQEEAIRRLLRSLKPHGVLVLVEDTPVGDQRFGDYIMTYPQDGWITLVQSLGARILKFIGVSFLRFEHARVPVRVAVVVDFLMGRIPWLKRRATVSAFAFTKV